VLEPLGILLREVDSYHCCQEGWMKHSWLNNISKYRLLRVLSRIYLKKVHFMPIGGIDALFTKSIDWSLIETHWQDMMQVILSIQAGKCSEPQSSGAGTAIIANFSTTLSDSIRGRETTLAATQTTLSATRPQSSARNHIICHQPRLAGRPSAWQLPISVCSFRIQLPFHELGDFRRARIELLGQGLR
jgi:hypothetical protein